MFDSIVQRQKVIALENLLAEFDRQGVDYIEQANGTPFPAYRDLTEKALRIVKDEMARPSPETLKRQEREVELMTQYSPLLQEIESIFTDVEENLDRYIAEEEAKWAA